MIFLEKNISVYDIKCYNNCTRFKIKINPSLIYEKISNFVYLLIL